MTRLEFKLIFKKVLVESKNNTIPDYFISQLQQYNFLLRTKLKAPVKERDIKEIMLIFEKRSHIQMMLRARKELCL